MNKQSIIFKLGDTIGGSPSAVENETMTVGELKSLLDLVDDSLPVTIKEDSEDPFYYAIKLDCVKRIKEL